MADGSSSAVVSKTSKSQKHTIQHVFGSKTLSLKCFWLPCGTAATVTKNTFYAFDTTNRRDIDQKLHSYYKEESSIPITAFAALGNEYVIIGKQNGNLDWYQLSPLQQICATQFPYVPETDKYEGLSPITLLATSNDSGFVAASSGRDICIFGSSGEHLHTLPGQVGGPEVSALTWLSYNVLAASAGAEVYSWRVNMDACYESNLYLTSISGENSELLSLTSAEIEFLTISPTGKLLAAVGKDGEVVLWYVPASMYSAPPGEDGEVPKPETLSRDFVEPSAYLLESNGSRAKLMEWSTRGQFLAVILDGRLRVWSVKGQVDKDQTSSVFQELLLPSCLQPQQASDFVNEEIVYFAFEPAKDGLIAAINSSGRLFVFNIQLEGAQVASLTFSLQMPFSQLKPKPEVEESDNNEVDYKVNWYSSSKLLAWNAGVGEMVDVFLTSRGALNATGPSHVGRNKLVDSKGGTRQSLHDMHHGKGHHPPSQMDMSQGLPSVSSIPVDAAAAAVAAAAAATASIHTISLRSVSRDGTDLHIQAGDHPSNFGGGSGGYNSRHHHHHQQQQQQQVFYASAFAEGVDDLDDDSEARTNDGVRVVPGGDQFGGVLQSQGSTTVPVDERASSARALDRHHVENQGSTVKGESFGKGFFYPGSGASSPAVKRSSRHQGLGTPTSGPPSLGDTSKQGSLKAGDDSRTAIAAAAAAAAVAAAAAASTYGGSSRSHSGTGSGLGKPYSSGAGGPSLISDAVKIFSSSTLQPVSSSGYGVDSIMHATSLRRLSSDVSQTQSLQSVGMTSVPEHHEFYKAQPPSYVGANGPAATRVKKISGGHVQHYAQVVQTQDASQVPVQHQTAEEVVLPSNRPFPAFKTPHSKAPTQQVVLNCYPQQAPQPHAVPGQGTSKSWVKAGVTANSPRMFQPQMVQQPQQPTPQQQQEWGMMPVRYCWSPTPVHYAGPRPDGTMVQGQQQPQQVQGGQYVPYHPGIGVRQGVSQPYMVSPRGPPGDNGAGQPTGPTSVIMSAAPPGHGGHGGLHGKTSTVIAPNVGGPVSGPSLLMHGPPNAIAGLTVLSGNGTGVPYVVNKSSLVGGGGRGVGPQYLAQTPPASHGMGGNPLLVQGAASEPTAVRSGQSDVVVELSVMDSNAGSGGGAALRQKNGTDTGGVVVLVDAVTVEGTETEIDDGAPAIKSVEGPTSSVDGTAEAGGPIDGSASHIETPFEHGVMRAAVAVPDGSSLPEGALSPSVPAQQNSSSDPSSGETRYAASLPRPAAIAVPAKGETTVLGVYSPSTASVVGIKRGSSLSGGMAILGSVVNVLAPTGSGRETGAAGLGASGSGESHPSSSPVPITSIAVSAASVIHPQLHVPHHLAAGGEILSQSQGGPHAMATMPPMTKGPGAVELGPSLALGSSAPNQNVSSGPVPSARPTVYVTQGNLTGGVYPYHNVGAGNKGAGGVPSPNGPASSSGPNTVGGNVFYAGHVQQHNSNNHRGYTTHTKAANVQSLGGPGGPVNHPVRNPPTGTGVFTPKSYTNSAGGGPAGPSGSGPATVVVPLNSQQAPVMTHTGMPGGPVVMMPSSVPGPGSSPGISPSSGPMPAHGSGMVMVTAAHVPHPYGTVTQAPQTAAAPFFGYQYHQPTMVTYVQASPDGTAPAGGQQWQYMPMAASAGMAPGGHPPMAVLPHSSNMMMHPAPMMTSDQSHLVIESMYARPLPQSPQGPRLQGLGPGQPSNGPLGGPSMVPMAHPMQQSHVSQPLTQTIYGVPLPAHAIGREGEGVPNPAASAQGQQGKHHSQHARNNNSGGSSNNASRNHSAHAQAQHHAVAPQGEEFVGGLTGAPVSMVSGMGANHSASMSGPVSNRGAPPGGRNANANMNSTGRGNGSSGLKYHPGGSNAPGGAPINSSGAPVAYAVVSQQQHGVEPPPQHALQPMLMTDPSQQQQPQTRYVPIQHQPTNNVMRNPNGPVQQVYSHAGGTVAVSVQQAQQQAQQQQQQQQPHGRHTGPVAQGQPSVGGRPTSAVYAPPHSVNMQMGHAPQPGAVYQGVHGAHPHPVVISANPGHHPVMIHPDMHLHHHHHAGAAMPPHSMLAVAPMNPGAPQGANVYQNMRPPFVVPAHLAPVSMHQYPPHPSHGQQPSYVQGPMHPMSPAGMMTQTVQAQMQMPPHHMISAGVVSAVGGAPRGGRRGGPSEGTYSVVNAYESAEGHMNSAGGMTYMYGPAGPMSRLNSNEIPVDFQQQVGQMPVYQGSKGPGGGGGGKRPSRGGPGTPTGQRTSVDSYVVTSETGTESLSNSSSNNNINISGLSNINHNNNGNSNASNPSASHRRSAYVTVPHLMPQPVPHAVQFSGAGGGMHPQGMPQGPKTPMPAGPGRVFLSPQGPGAAAPPAVGVPLQMYAGDQRRPQTVKVPHGMVHVQNPGDNRSYGRSMSQQQQQQLGDMSSHVDISGNAGRDVVGMGPLGGVMHAHAQGHAPQAQAVAMQAQQQQHFAGGPLRGYAVAGGYEEEYERASSDGLGLDGQAAGGPPMQRSASGSEQFGCTLYVGCIAESVDEEALSGVFSEHGPIESVQVIRNPETGSSRGYGFVTYAHQNYASEAFRKLQGAMLPGAFLKKPLKLGPSLKRVA